MHFDVLEVVLLARVSFIGGLPVYLSTLAEHQEGELGHRGRENLRARIMACASASNRTAPEIELLGQACRQHAWRQALGAIQVGSASVRAAGGENGDIGGFARRLVE